MSEVFYKDEVTRARPGARIAVVRPRGMPLYVVVAGREGRYLGALEATTKAAWQSAWNELPKGKPGDGSGQMGLELGVRP